MTGRSAPTLLLGLLILSTAACAHVQPYHRYDVAPVCEPVPHYVVDARLLMIGDAGDPSRGGEPVLALLREKASELPERTTVVFLGDNVYERGMPSVDDIPDALEDAAEAAKLVLPDFVDTRKEAERCLNAQIDVVRGTQIPAVFIPGNHDWDQFALDGWERILEQEKFIDAARTTVSNVWMLPPGGCPGPVSLPLGRRGMLIVLDTQWWLETAAYGKPTTDNNPTGCPYVDEEAILNGLVMQLAVARRERRRVVVAGHHPLESRGPHGGFAEGITHLFPLRFLRHYVPFYLEWFPLPVLGTAAVLARQYFSPSAQDFSNSRNERMRVSLREAMANAEAQGAPALAYAAGHDHALQVFRTEPGPHYALVSGLGSASRASTVGAANNTLFAHSDPLRPGFMQLDFLKDGTVRLSVIEVSPPQVPDGTEPVEGCEVFSLMLTSGRLPSVSRWQRWLRRHGGNAEGIDEDP